MNIGNALINSLVVSGLILIAAMIFGITAEKKPVVTRRPARARRRSAEIKSQARFPVEAQPRVRVSFAGGGR